MSNVYISDNVGFAWGYIIANVYTCFAGLPGSAGFWVAANVHISALM